MAIPKTLWLQDNAQIRPPVARDIDTETATATPRSPVSCTLRARGHTLIQDKPPASGGEDEGPMASEFLLAALLSCQLSTFAKVAGKRGAAIEAVSIRGELRFEGDDIAKVVLHWLFDGGEEKERAALVRLTDRICTISRCLKVPVEAHHDTA